MGLNETDIRRIVWTFVQAFVAALAAGVAGWAAFPSDWNGLKAAGAALVVSALAAALSAVKNLVLPDGSTLK